MSKQILNPKPRMHDIDVLPRVVNRAESFKIGHTFNIPLSKACKKNLSNLAQTAGRDYKVLSESFQSPGKIDACLIFYSIVNVRLSNFD